MQYEIYEPQSEYLRIIDPLTHGIIYCINRNHLRTHNWKERFLIGNNVPIIDVTTVKPISNKTCFTHDSFVDQGKTQQFTELFIDYACLMHHHLSRSGSVVVHCKNGRSRSPTILLAFMMLRGILRPHAIAWLTKAFQVQRPTITARSAQFPNFVKFDNVTMHLDASLEKEWLVIRVDQNFKVLLAASSSSSSTSTTSNSSSNFTDQLQGRLWTQPLVMPDKWKRILPASSCCLSTNAYGSLLNNTNSSEGERKRSTRGSKTSSNTSILNPNTQIAGRRIKIKQQQKSNKYQTGTLVSYDRCWNIDLDDGTKKRINRTIDLYPAFPIGSRVAINWEFRGEIVDGVVTEWKGGGKYFVWFDKEKRIYQTNGAEILPSMKDLPKHCPRKIHDLVDASEVDTPFSLETQTELAKYEANWWKGKLKQTQTVSRKALAIQEASEKKERDQMRLEEKREFRFRLWRGIKKKNSKHLSSRYAGVSKSKSTEEKNKYNQNLQMWNSFGTKPGATQRSFLGEYDTEEEAARAHDACELSNWQQKKPYWRALNYSVRLIIATTVNEMTWYFDANNTNGTKEEYIVRDHHSQYGVLIAVPVANVESIPSYRIFNPSETEWEYSSGCLTGMMHEKEQRNMKQQILKSKNAAIDAEAKKLAALQIAEKTGCWLRVPNRYLHGQHILKKVDVSLLKLFHKHPKRDQLINLVDALDLQKKNKNIMSASANRDTGNNYRYKSKTAIADENLKGRWIDMYTLFNELVTYLNFNDDGGKENKGSPPSMKRNGFRDLSNVSGAAVALDSSTSSSSSTSISEHFDQNIESLCKQRYPCFRCCFYTRFQANPTGSVAFIRKAMLHWERELNYKNEQKIQKAKIKTKGKKEKKRDLSDLTSNTSIAPKAKKARVEKKKTTHAQLNNTKIKEKKNEKKQLVRKFQEDNNKSRTIKAKTKTTSAKKQKKSKSKFDNLQEMLLAGVIQSGKNVLVVPYKGVDHMADLTDKGEIISGGQVFSSLSSFSSYSKLGISDNGWTSTYYKGQQLNEYRLNIEKCTIRHIGKHLQINRPVWVYWHDDEWHPATVLKHIKDGILILWDQKPRTQSLVPWNAIEFWIAKKKPKKKNSIAFRNLIHTVKEKKMSDE